MNRREFLQAAGIALALPWACARWSRPPSGMMLNDLHSGLDPTRISEVVPVRSPDDIRRAIERPAREGEAVSVAGGRHAMGGQQVGTDTVHLDTRPFNRVLNFDGRSGLIEVEAGIQWPDLVKATLELQKGASNQWGIVQRQTGADRLSLGGSLAASIHGRGLTLKPFVGDIAHPCRSAGDRRGAVATALVSRARRQDAGVRDLRPGVSRDQRPDLLVRYTPDELLPRRVPQVAGSAAARAVGGIGEDHRGVCSAVGAGVVLRGGARGFPQEQDRRDLRAIRLIERDDETFLAWARIAGRVRC